MTVLVHTMCRSGLDGGVYSILALFEVFLQTLIIFFSLYYLHYVKHLQLLHFCSQIIQLKFLKKKHHQYSV